MSIMASVEPAAQRPRGAPAAPPELCHRGGGPASKLGSPADSLYEVIQYTLSFTLARRGRDVSSQYGGRDETCPVSTGGGSRCRSLDTPRDDASP